VVVVAEAGEFREEFPQALPAVPGAGGAVEEGAGGEGEVCGEDLSEFFGDGIAGGGMEVGGVFGELGEPVALLDLSTWISRLPTPLRQAVGHRGAALIHRCRSDNIALSRPLNLISRRCVPQ
jgi:hypothetical protein